MRIKVQKLIEAFTNTLKAWNAVDSITLGDSADIDILDPYFSLNIDVYYNGKIPNAAERKDLFPQATLFEPSLVHTKDRFMVEDLPVSIEYKNQQRIREILSNLEVFDIEFKENGTFLFYRLQKGEAVYNKSNWIFDVKEQLQNLPLSFWNSLITAGMDRLEHLLSDLSASVIKDDSYFFHITLAQFVQTACYIVFASNHFFDPSPCQLKQQLQHLPQLPDNFKSWFECLIRTDGQLGPDRKKEIAQLIVKSLINLSYQN